VIYILGVNDHRYQAINPSNNPYEGEFSDYVLKQVQAKNINHLAEEMNDEFLQRENGAQVSVCRKMASDLEISHSMCEPTSLEKTQLGYIDKSWEEFLREDETGSSEKVNAAYSAFHRKQWHIRETFWFEKLKPHLNENVLFVCGAQHSNRFSKVLKSKGIKNRVICKRWKP
jgi:asparagine synthetase A